MHRLILATLLLAACGDKDDTSDSVVGTDADGDGWTVEDGDCDDSDASDASVYPGAPEESDTDAWDQNCDGPGE